jgi:hypothetical protein
MAKNVQTSVADLKPATPPVSSDGNGTPPQATPPATEAKKGNKKGVKADPNEPKDVKFRRLANRRVNNALRILSHIGNLSSRSSYEYTSEQAAKIIAVLNGKVKEIADKFAGTKRAATGFEV